MTTTVSTSAANGPEYTWATANFAWSAYPANTNTWASDFMQNYALSAGETAGVNHSAGVSASLSCFDTVSPGSSALVQVPYSAVLDILGAVTLEVWVKYTDTGNWILLEKSSNNSHYQLQPMSTSQAGAPGRIAFMTQASGWNNGPGGIVTNKSLNDGNWHHVVATWDGVNTAYMYVDGVLDKTNTGLTAKPLSNTQPLNIGNRTVNGVAQNLAFGGRISGVRVYSRVLSAAEVASRYLDQPISTAGLVLDVPLMDGEGTALKDYSGNALDGTLMGVGQLSPDAPPYVGDSIQKALQRPLAETWATAEQWQQSFGKALLEAWATAESVASTFQISLAEAWATAEALAQTCGLALADVWATADALVKAYAQGVSETLGASSDALASQESFNPQFSESVTFAEQLALAYGLPVAEAAQFADAFSQAYQLAGYDNLNLAEQLGNVAAWQRAFSEAFYTTDAWQANFGKAALETVALAEAQAFAYSQALAEGLGVADALDHAMTFLRAFAETLASVEACGFNDSLPLPEAFQTADSECQGYAQGLFEAFQTADNWSRVAQFHAAWQEACAFAESLGKFFTRPQAEAFATYDAIQQTYGLQPGESVNVAEQLVKGITYIRDWAEQFQTADHEQIVWNHLAQLAEAVNFYAEYRRNPNAVLSDIRLGKNEITFDQFKQLLDTSGAVGFEDFHAAVAGDYQYTRALFKAAVDSTNADRPQISALGVSVDMPDIFDRGSANTPATTITISYNREFFVVPELSVRQTGGVAVADIKISNETKTGFDVQLQDANGNGVAGSISWMAHGY